MNNVIIGKEETDPNDLYKPPLSIQNHSSFQNSKVFPFIIEGINNGTLVFPENVESLMIYGDKMTDTPTLFILPQLKPEHIKIEFTIK